MKMCIGDHVLQVNDEESAIMTRRMAKEEGLFIGWSCGAAVAGALNYLDEHPMKDDETMVIILPDSGTRYVSKVYNDDWMQEQGFSEQ